MNEELMRQEDEYINLWVDEKITDDELVSKLKDSAVSEAQMFGFDGVNHYSVGSLMRKLMGGIADPGIQNKFSFYNCIELDGFPILFMTIFNTRATKFELMICNPKKHHRDINCINTIINSDTKFIMKDIDKIVSGINSISIAPAMEQYKSELIDDFDMKIYNRRRSMQDRRALPKFLK